MSLLHLDGVTFTYTGAGAPALEDITFDVEAGEIVAVFGRPGSGTSSLLLVAGGYAPRVVGGEMSGTIATAAVQPAIVFATPWTQLTGLCSTVFSEVAFGPASHGLPPGTIREIVTRQLERLGIGHLAQRDPATLSGGELQRAIVAAALALEPDLLLLDDPAAELDPVAADALYDLLIRVAAAGTAIMVATPDDERATRVASRAIVLEHGRIVYDGAAEGVRA